MAGVQKRTFWYRNSLSLLFLVLFLGSLAAQALTGWKEHNEFLAEHGRHATTFGWYLTSGHFIQATFENWESEFLQMGLFVIFTIFLRQQGSSESKKLEKPVLDPEDLKPKEDSPWPVRRGGIWLAVYRHSLTIALLLLFVVSFVLHWYGSWVDHVEQEAAHGANIKTFWEYAGTAKLWFESFQNWQSEFLSVLAIVFLSIYLRQDGSPQSKPVNASRNYTGN